MKRKKFLGQKAAEQYAKEIYPGHVATRARDKAAHERALARKAADVTKTITKRQKAERAAHERREAERAARHAKHVRKSLPKVTYDVRA